MSASSTQYQEGGLNDDMKKLLIRFFAILAVSPMVGWMMARAWVPGNLLYDLIGSVMQSILQIDQVKGLEVLAMGGLGFYLGVLTVFLIDIKKRVQGALLLVGTVLGLTVLTVQGVFLPNIEFGYLPNVGIFFLAYVGALALDGDKLLSLSLAESTLRDPRTASGEVPEFSNAAMALFGLLSAVIVLSLVQVFVAGAFQPTDVLATPATIYLLYGFVQYEVKSDYMLLGPSKSGKSMAMLGMALTMYDFEDIQPDPNPYLQRAIERASDPEYGEQWPFEQTEGLQETSFQLLVGDLFPRRMRLVAYDYPGQLLPQIADQVQQLSSSSLLDGIPFLGGDTAPQPKTDGGVGAVAGDDIAMKVASDVVESDILMIVIDCERLVHPQTFDEAESGGENPGRTLGIEHYKPILQSADVGETIIAVTKADVLIHDDAIPVEPPEVAGGFQPFKTQVNEMLGDRYDVQELQQALNQSEIHPVFYKTEKRDGEYVPLRDGSNNLIPVGYDSLVDAIRAGA